MELIDTIGKRLSEVAKQVEERSGELLETGKLNIEIFKEEEAIRKLNRKIGEIVYKAYTLGSDYSGIVDGHCNEIAERYGRIDELKLKINGMRNQRAATEDIIEDIVDDTVDVNDISYSSSPAGPCPYCGGHLPDQ